MTDGEEAERSSSASFDGEKETAEHFERVDILRGG